MEFFCCPCPVKAKVVLDGKALGSNMDNVGNLLTKQCDEGLHTITLLCPAGKRCAPLQVMVEIKGTDPISPLEIAFQCTG